MDEPHDRLDNGQCGENVLGCYDLLSMYRGEQRFSGAVDFTVGQWRGSGSSLYPSVKGIGGRGEGVRSTPSLYHHS